MTTTPTRISLPERHVRRLISATFAALPTCRTDSATPPRRNVHAVNADRHFLVFRERKCFTFNQPLLREKENSNSSSSFDRLSFINTKYTYRGENEVSKIGHPKLSINFTIHPKIVNHFRMAYFLTRFAPSSPYIRPAELGESGIIRPAISVSRNLNKLEKYTWYRLVRDGRV